MMRNLLLKYGPIPIYIGNIVSGYEIPPYDINSIISDDMGADNAGKTNKDTAGKS